MKKIIYFTLLFSLLSFNVYAKNKRQEAKVGHLFLGVSRNLTPSDLRVGRHNWELGIIRLNTFGFHYLINFNDNLYTAIGLGIHGANSDPAVLGALGIEFWNFWIANFRFEAGGAVDIRNQHSVDLALGISLNI